MTGGEGTDSSGVNRRGLLALVGGTGAVGLVGYLATLVPKMGGTPDSELPNWLEYAFSPRVNWVSHASLGIRPAVGADSIVGRHNHQLHALDRDNGDKLWTVEVTDGDPSIPDPVVADGLVYTHRPEEELIALDATDGTVRWTADTVEYEAQGPPTVVDDTVYAAIGTTVQAFDTDDGGQQWAVEPFANRTFPGVEGSPAVDDGTVYVGGLGEVAALDADDGTEQWSAPVGDQLFDVEAIGDGTMYLTAQESLYALSTTDGRERWSVDGQEPSVTVADGTAYVSMGDTLYAFAAEDGTEQWRFDAPDEEVRSEIIQMPMAAAVDEDTVYVGPESERDSPDKLYALDTTDGSEGWSFPVGDLDGMPLVDDGTVYVSASGVFSLDA